MNGEPGVDHHDLIEQRELLSAYLDGELSASERQALAQHLASCDTCGEELDALRQVRTLLRALPSPALPRSFTLPETGALPTATFHAAERKRPRVARIVQWAGGVAAAAGFALLIGSAMLARGPMTAASSTASNAYAPAAGAAHVPAAAPTTSQDQSRLTGTGSAGGAATPNATAHALDRTTATPAPDANNNIEPASETASAGQTVREVLPYAGAGLASGGLLLLVGGSVVARRQRS